MGEVNAETPTNLHTPTNIATPQKPLEEEVPEASEPEVHEYGPLDKVSLFVNKGMSSVFGALTKKVTTYPKLAVLGTFILTAVLFQGVWMFEEETNGRELYAPKDSRAIDEDEYVEHTFGFDPRLTTFYLEANDDNVLTAKYMNLLMTLQDEVTLRLSDGAISYNTTCKRVGQRSDTSPCLAVKGPLTLWDNSAPRVALLTDADVLAAVNNAEQWRMYEPSGPSLGYYVSDVGLQRDADGNITKAKAVRMQLLLKNERGDLFDGKIEDDESEAFEVQMLDYVLDVFKGIGERENFEIEIQTQKEEDDAGQDAMDKDMAVLAVGYILMFAYACFVLSRARPKYSHAALGLISVFTVSMSTLSAYGLCWFIGWKFNTVTQVLILVLLGVGIDDTFVIMDSWWDHAHVQDMQTRMIEAVKHAGPAITITSLTDLVAFLAGSSTKIPALQIFCYYAALGITFTFLYQCIMVVAVAYMDSKRQEAGRRDFLCCVTAGDNDGWFGTCCVPQTSTSTEPAQEEAGKKFNEADRGLLHYIVGELLPRYVIATWTGRGIVFAITIFVLVAAGIGLPKVTMNYNNEWFVPEGHRYRDAMEMRDEYFEGSTLQLFLYSKTEDYPSHATQMTQENMVVALNDNKWVREGTVNSWARSFALWVNETTPQYVNATSGYLLVDTVQFYPLLKTFVGATGPRYAAEFNDDFVWSTSGGANDADAVLTSTKMSFLLVPGPLSDGQKAVDCMDDLRALLDPMGESFAYHYVFLFWESYKVFVPEIIKNVSIAAACVFVLVTLLAANAFIGLFVLIAIALIDFCLLGFMPWIGVEVNGVSVICVVLAIGLAVDYSVHIAGAFLTISAEPLENGASSRTQRAAHALWKMGPAVINGGFSTFLAVTPLFFATSYVFRVFFRMFTLIIFFGLWFGVLVLPCVLSIIGPKPNPAPVKLEDQPWTNPLHPDFENEKEKNAASAINKEMDAEQHL